MKKLSMQPRPENGELISQYLVAIHLPDNFSLSAADEAAT